MEQQTNLSDVWVVFSVTASLVVSLSSVQRTCQDEYAEDDYDHGPDGGPEVDSVSACLQK